MLTLITGAPGTGKSAALVSLLSELSKTRAIYVDGIPELTLDHQVLEPTKWHETVPDGSIIVIDEVQRVWRPRGPGTKVPPDIAALETHRHRGLDFYIITQAPRLVDTNVRALIGRHVHLRDLGILGRWWYEWPECAEQCSSSWKTAPIKKRYRLPKAIFNTYKSASEHIKPVRSMPMMLLVMIFALLATAALAYRGYVMISGKMTPAATAPKKDASIDDIVNRPKPPGSSAAAPAVPEFDPTAFFPRVPTKPETAPAYDALRVVVNLPLVVGGVCMGERCKCFTQQGSDAGLTSSECSEWLKNPPFDPYRVAAAPMQVPYSPKPLSAAHLDEPVPDKRPPVALTPPRQRVPGLPT